MSEALRSWYMRAELASVILPEGQLGGPGDLWPLTRAEVWGNRLLIELGGRVLMLVLRPNEFEMPAGKFIMRGFSRLTIEQEAVGATESRTLVFKGGILEFWGRDRQRPAWEEHQSKGQSTTPL